MNPTVKAPESRVPLKNALLNLLGSGIPLLLGVLTLPLIIRGLGKQRFGLLSMAWVVMVNLTAFDLGLGRATTKHLAADRQDGDARCLIWTSLAAQFVLGLAAAGLLAAGTPLFVDKALDLGPSLSAEAKASFFLVAAFTPLILMSSTLRGALEARQRFDYLNAVRAPLLASNFLLPLIGISLGWNLSGIVLMLAVATLTGVLAYFAFCTRVFPGLAGSPSFDPKWLRRLLGYGKWITVSAVVSPILVYFDRFVLASLVSVSAVAYYTAAFDTVTRLWIVPASLVAALFPLFARLGREGDVSSVASRSIHLILMLLGGPVIFIVANSRELLHLWLGPDFAANSAVVLVLLACGVLVNSLAHVPYTVIQALGRPDLTGKLHLVELPFYLVMLPLMVMAWGLAGAAAAWFVRSVADAVLLLILAGALPGQSGAVSWLGPSRRALVPLAALAAVSAAAAALPLSARLATGLAALAVFGVVAFKTLVLGRGAIVPDAVKSG